LANTQCFQKKISGRGKHNATSRKKHYWVVSQRGGIDKQNRTSLIKLSLLFFISTMFWKLVKKTSFLAFLGKKNKKGQALKELMKSEGLNATYVSFCLSWPLYCPGWKG
jgi:hypothetical protein